ncbi:hypothetical protein HYR65_03255 [Candidatus Azambacteria bacterium]|nr:hypothetical protein [Candidatus Azambacteria bacterium]
MFGFPIVEKPIDFLRGGTLQALPSDLETTIRKEMPDENKIERSINNQNEGGLEMDELKEEMTDQEHRERLEKQIENQGIQTGDEVEIWFKGGTVSRGFHGHLDQLDAYLGEYLPEKRQRAYNIFNGNPKTFGLGTAEVYPTGTSRIPMRKIVRIVKKVDR